MAASYPRLEVKKLSDLNVLADATRTMSIEARFNLKRQFNTFGFLQVHIVLNVKTGRVLGGRKSVSVLRDLQIEEAPVWCIDIEPPLEDTVAMLLDNHAGEWEWQPVSEQLKAMQDKKIIPELTGFPDYEIGPLASAVWSKEDVEQDAKAPSQELTLGL